MTSFFCLGQENLILCYSVATAEGCPPSFREVSLGRELEGSQTGVSVTTTTPTGPLED